MRLERLPLSRYHRQLLVISGLGYMFDQMDLQIIGTSVTALSISWELNYITTGYILGAGFIGLFTGAIIVGLLSDYFGRKKMFQFTFLLFTLSSALAAFTQNSSQLILCRFVIGIGLGGELPVVASLISELVPSHARGRYLSILNAFNAVGALAAAGIGYLIVPANWGPLAGWQLAFLTCSIPAFYVWIIRRNLPESPRWLEARGRRLEALCVIEGIENRTGHPDRNPAELIVTQKSDRNSSPLRELFSTRFIRETVVTCLLWGCAYFVFYALLAWLPSLLVAQGYTVPQSLRINLFLSVMFLPGALTVSRLIEKLGRKRVVGIFTFTTMISLLAWGYSNAIQETLIWGSIAYFSGAGMLNAIASYTAELFATRIRGTGMGLASAVGRFSSFVGVAAVGPMFMIARISGLFAVFSGLLCLGIVAILLGKETKGKSLEEIGVS